MSDESIFAAGGEIVLAMHRNYKVKTLINFSHI